MCTLYDILLSPPVAEMFRGFLQAILVWVM